MVTNNVFPVSLLSRFVKQINRTMQSLQKMRPGEVFNDSYSMDVNKWWVVYAEIQYNGNDWDVVFWTWTLSTIIASLLSSIILVMMP